MRVAVDEVRVEADDLEQLLGAAPPRAPRPDAVDEQRLADDVADGHPRVQRGVRVLEDDLDLAPDLAKVAAAHRRQLAPVERHGSLGRLQQLENAEARGRLARAGLAHEPDGLPGRTSNETSSTALT